MDYVQIIGYLGSALIAISLSMKNIYYLRRINLLGASTFAFYGLMMNAIPVFLLNSYIALIDIYYLIETKRKKEYFSLLQIGKGECSLLSKFLNFYIQDIKLFFPNFEAEIIDKDKSFFILRNLIPVGLFVYRELAEDEILIELDYAIPDYRDLKNARFVYFAQSNHFKAKGYKTIRAITNVDKHKKYLIKIGFKQEGNLPGNFIKQI